MGEYSLQWSGVREVAYKLAKASPDLQWEVLQHCFELLFHQPASGEKWEHFLQTYRETCPSRAARVLSALSTRDSQRFKATSVAKITMAYNAAPKLNLLDIEIERY